MPYRRRGDLSKELPVGLLGEVPLPFFLVRLCLRKQVFRIPGLGWSRIEREGQEKENKQDRLPKLPFFPFSPELFRRVHAQGTNRKVGIFAERTSTKGGLVAMEKSGELCPAPYTGVGWFCSWAQSPHP